MASPSSMTSASVSSTPSARVLGALSAIAALATAVLLAVAVTRIAHGQISSGLWLAVGFLGVRWLVARATEEWGHRVGSSARERWRRGLPQHLTRPRTEREHSRADLALSIEQASMIPSLDLLASSARTSLLGLGLVLWAAGWLSFSITVALLALAVPLYRRAGRRSEVMSAEYEARRSLLESRQLELLQHAPELRALGAVEYGANEIAAISDSEHVIALRAIRVALESSLITEFLSGVSIGLVAMVVGFSLLAGHVTLVRALVAVLASSEVFLAVRRYGTEFHRRDDSMRAVVVLQGFDVAPTCDAGDVVLWTSGLVTEANDQAVTLRVLPGHRVLVTGPSGSGKTTLLRTFLEWRAPREGSLARTRQPVAYVSAESSLLSGSLRDNLILGAEIADGDVVSVMNSLGLRGHRFDDLDTLLLADGRGLSSGERVRLVLARSLLCQPALLVLDDVAGVLDVTTRTLVRDLLERRVDLAIIEAAVDTPLLTRFDQRIEVHS